ncbi:hypothetical protein Tco_0112350 [Tanacetum coccineum]
MANNSIKNDSLATLYGKYNYEKGLIDRIYELDTQRFIIQALSSKALISNNQFQDSDSYVEEDMRSNTEFIVDLILNRDYKGKYKRLKAKINVLTKKIDAMSKGKSEKGLVAESFDWDEESVSSKDKGTTKIKAFMAIAE